MKQKTTYLILGAILSGCFVFQSCSNDYDDKDLFSSSTEREKGVKSVDNEYSMDEVIAFAANYVTVENNEAYKLNLSREEALENNISIDQYTELLSIVENINVQLAQIKNDLPQGKTLVISNPQRRTKSRKRVRNLASEESQGIYSFGSGQSQFTVDVPRYEPKVIFTASTGCPGGLVTLSIYDTVFAMSSFNNTCEYISGLSPAVLECTVSTICSFGGTISYRCVSL